MDMDVACTTAVWFLLCAFPIIVHYQVIVSRKRSIQMQGNSLGRSSKTSPKEEKLKQKMLVKVTSPCFPPPKKNNLSLRFE